VERLPQTDLTVTRAWQLFGESLPVGTVAVALARRGYLGTNHTGN